MSLSCYRRIFADLLSSDGLLVMGRGLGLRTLVAKFLKIYAVSPSLVFLINATGEEQLLCDMLLADGLPPERLPTVVDADMDAPARRKLYAAGGCIIITSRILLVDLLSNRVERSAIAGFLVANAHRVSEQCSEAFILRLYREKNGTGFIKAFSDDPETLVSGFNRTEKVMRALWVQKLFLWPRFHVLMARDLDAPQCQPQVIELAQPQTSLMQAVQRAICECADACLKDISRSAVSVDTSELTMENVLFESFDVSIRRQLDPIWNTVPARVKGLIGDLRTLRKLLGYVSRYDAVSFYVFLDMLRAAAWESKQARSPPTG